RSVRTSPATGDTRDRLRNRPRSSERRLARDDVHRDGAELRGAVLRDVDAARTRATRRTGRTGAAGGELCGRRSGSAGRALGLYDEPVSPPALVRPGPEPDVVSGRVGHGEQAHAVVHVEQIADGDAGT